MNVQELINQAVRTNRERKEQRHWFISRLGACPTGQYLERLGAEPDAPFTDRLMRVFNVGNVFEKWIVDLVADQMVPFTNDPLLSQVADEAFRLEQKAQWIEEHTQLPVEDVALDISGYADLLIEKDGNRILYEIKSKNSRAFWYMVDKGEGANRQHEIQLWVYLNLLDIPEGRLLYVSKDDLTIAEFTVRRDDHKLNIEVAEILAGLNEAWEKKVPPQPITDKKDWRYKYCNWHKQCMEYAKETV